jgi:hypothetical protein
VSGKVAVGASDGAVRAAAEDAALSGASALGAVLAGYFAAAGGSPGVLLGPLSLVLCGFGATRALDGRCRQPGLSAKRPRGFVDEAEVPMAARVAVPASVAALMVATGYDKERRLAAMVKVGVVAAKANGAPRRAEFLQHIARVGAGLFSEAAVRRLLLHAAGPSQGGLLSSADFAAVPEVDTLAVRTPLGDGFLLCPAWATTTVSPQTEFIGAIDARGGAAMLCYERATEGLTIAEWDLLAPACAVPVMRGVTRVRAGVPLVAPAPIAIELDARGVPGAVRTHPDVELAGPGFRVAATG